MTADIYPGLSGGAYWWWIPVIPLAAGGVVLLGPRLAAGIVPLSLIVSGLAGLGLARVYLPDGEPYRFGLARIGDSSMTGLILAQAFLLFLTGGWLGWRELASRPAAARLVLGRLAAPDRAQEQWGLLLLPVCVVAAEFVGSDVWLDLMLVLLAGSMLIIRLWPGVAGGCRLPG